MSFGNEKDEKNLICSDFEDQLSDYLEGNLGGEMHRAMASHALKCPLCHELRNEVKGNLELCRVIAEPAPVLTKLEAGIMARTMPETEMGCDEFEECLTDYLDGFLPAQLFHRWERHAAVCSSCTDMPGAVVRSIGVCYTFKMEELPLPEGLHERILQSTLGTINAETLRASAGSRAAEWLRSWLRPISIPLPQLRQLAPVAMVLLFAVLLFSHVIPADASLTTVYQQSFQMAGQTYIQGADSLEAGINNFSSSVDGSSTNNPEQKTQESEQKPTYVNGGAAR